VKLGMKTGMKAGMKMRETVKKIYKINIDTI
jgi:hypothetical protein